MDCARAKEEFSALLDGELTPEESAAVRAHLAECSECLREMEQLKRVDHSFRSLGMKQAPANFEERVSAAFRPTVVQFRRPALRHRSVWPLAFAAAAMLLVAVTAFLRTPGRGGRFDVASESAPPAASPEILAVPAAPQEAQSHETAPTAPKSARAPAAPVEAGLNEQDTEQLRAMGYLQSESKPAKDEPQRDGGGAAPESAPAPPQTLAAPRPSRAPAKPVTAELPAEVEDQMRALGYLGDESKKLEEDKAAETPATPDVPEAPKAKGIARDASDGAGAPGSEAASSTPPVIASEPPAEMPMLDAASEETATASDINGYGLEAQSVPKSPRMAADALAASPPPSPPPPSVLGGEGSGAKPAEPSRTLRETAGRTFEWRDGTWVEAGYAGQKTVKLMPDSKKLGQLQSEHEDLADVVALGGKVIFRVKQDWYELRAPQN